MLAALLLLGLLPLAMLPLFEGSDSAPDDSASENDGFSDPASDVGSEPSTDFLTPDPLDDGELFSILAEPGSVALPDFQVGVDSVLVDLTEQTEIASLRISTLPIGPTVSFVPEGDDPTTLIFEGLTVAPVDDISVRVFDEFTGDPVEMSLRDAVAAGDVDIEPVLIEPLDPVDPETPDTPGPSDPTPPALDPVDPDTPDEPGPVEPTSPVIDPTDPDAEDFGTTADMPLRDLIQRDSDNEVGMSAALQGAQAAGVTDTTLTDSDDAFRLPEGGGDTTGITMERTTPNITSDGTVDVVDAGAGDDELTAGSSASYVFGGAGDDSLIGGTGSSALYGGDGADRVQASPDGATYGDGGLGDDLLLGGAGNDTLEGGEHATPGQAGQDTLLGGAGDDHLRGGYGADSLEGGEGNDIIDHLGRTEERQSITHHEFAWHVSSDADSLSGGEGDDTLVFDRFDTASGGEGNDVFLLYHDGADGTDVAIIEDFVNGQDILTISLNPQIGENDVPEVEVRPSDDGADGHVIVNGDLVAIVRGVPDLTSEGISAVVEPDVFP